MAKNNNIATIDETTNTTNTVVEDTVIDETTTVVEEPVKVLTLREAMQTYEKLSLRKIAEATNTNYNMILKTSKQPIPGVPYDPVSINYEAVEVYLSKKYEDAIDYVDIANTDVNVITKMPFEVAVGQSIKLRTDDEVYQVLVVTITHVVILAEGGTQPRVFSNATFIHQGPKIAE